MLFLIQTNKMKLLNLTVCFLMFLETSNRVDSAECSETNNGVYIAISGWRPGFGPVSNEQFIVTDKFVLAAFCNTGKVEMAFPASFEHGLKVKMLDKSGRLIKKTRRGELIGGKFDSISIQNPQKTLGLWAWGSVEDNPGLGGGVFLPSLYELFGNISNGVYKLEFQAQLFKSNGKTSDTARFNELICFKPVKITINLTNFAHLQ